MGISLEFIEKYKGKHWHFVSYNTNITIKFIDEYFDKIDFQRVSCSKF